MKITRCDSDKEEEIFTSFLVQRTYHRKSFNTLFINNEFFATIRDHVSFVCYSCKKEKTEFFNKKFCNSSLDEVVCQKCSSERICLEKYGIKNGGGSKIALEKIRESCVRRYSAENYFQSEAIKEAAKQTKIKRYGDPYFTNREKAKRTTFKHYGVEYPAQNYEICQKTFAKLTNSFATKKYNGIDYQSSKELEFIKLCESSHLNIKNGPSIDYFWQGKNHIYHIDFETDSSLIEIKARHYWYKTDLESGKIDAKNRAAEAFAKSINKQFLFILEKNDMITIVDNLENDKD